MSKLLYQGHGSFRIVTNDNVQYYYSPSVSMMNDRLGGETENYNELVMTPEITVFESAEDKKKYFFLFFYCISYINL